MRKTLQDIQYGLRALKKSPGFAALAILTMALGMGANTAIFSVVNAALIKPLPFRQPDRLVQLFETETAPGDYPFAGPDFVDWKAQNSSFESMTLISWGHRLNVGGSGSPETVTANPVDADFFSVLGVEPMLGRGFQAGEDRAGQNHEVVLSTAFWKKHFAGRQDIIGQSIEMDGESYAVVGVMPAWFRYPSNAQMWIPMDMTPKGLGPRGSHSYSVIGRLKPGVTAAQAKADLQTIASRLEKQFPDSNTNVGASIKPLREELLGDSRPLLLNLLGAAALVLLIASANVASLLLVRAMGREREMAVRSSLGASAGRIIRQLLTENLMLSLAGAACGLFLAWWVVEFFRTNAATLAIPSQTPISIDGTVLAFTILVGVFIGVLFGLAPALHIARPNLMEGLRAGAQNIAGQSGRRRMLHNALIVGEIALSLALLVGAGLLLRSFANLRQNSIGVQTKNVLTMKVSLPARQYGTLAHQREFFDQLLARLQEIPGVNAAAIASEIPVEGTSNGYVKIPGETNHALDQQLVEWNYISPDYFRALGIPFQSGRNFSPSDYQSAADQTLEWDKAQEKDPHAPPPADIHFVAVINSAMAKTFWPGREDVLGKTYKWDGVPVSVIGVVGDVKEWSLQKPAAPQAYYPLPLELDGAGNNMNFVLQTSVAPSAVVSAVREQLRGLDDSLGIYSVRTMPEVIADNMSQTTNSTVLLGAFAGLALLLAAIGLYGAMSYAVSQRTHEIGVRMALGAEPGNVLRMVTREGMTLALAGLLFGTLAALGLTRWVTSLLFGVRATDPLTFIAVAGTLFAVAFLACYIPARRAMRVDPMVALRYE